MAGDVPARIEAHATLGVGENLHALGVECVEAGVREHLPMGAAEIVQAFELGVTIEVARGIGKTLETMEEIAKRGLEMRQEQIPVFAH